MTEKQKKFLELMNEVMPKMTELEQEKLLAFGDGLVFMTQGRVPTRTTEAERPGA